MNEIEKIIIQLEWLRNTLDRNNGTIDLVLIEQHIRDLDDVIYRLKDTLPSNN